MSAKPEFSFIVTIAAKSEDKADDVRAEIVGAAEDLIESGEVRSEDLSWSSLESGCASEKLAAYRKLHDQIGGLLKSGKLDSLHPADYEELISAMQGLIFIDPAERKPSTLGM